MLLIQIILYTYFGIINASSSTSSNTHHCRDIDAICQELATDHHCFDTDFVRHFCPISCRNPNCASYFPSFTSKSSHWQHISSTLCHYPNINPSISPALYFNQYPNISINECQNECDHNPLCTHIIYIKYRILAQTPTDSLQNVFFNSQHTHYHTPTALEYDNNNISLHICIHSYIPSKLCQPICLNSDTLNTHLLNRKQDTNTQTATAQALEPFIFSTIYEYISPFSLYIKEEHQQNVFYWNVFNDFNKRHKVLAYEPHEYYSPHMMAMDDINTPPMLEAPKLTTFAGENKVRLEFESRVNRILQVSWINTRNQQEYFQDTLEANKWSITKARNSFNGHVFVIRDSLTKEWVTSYRNNPSHTNVFITITPYGVCVRDEASILSGIKNLRGARIIDVREINATKWLKETEVKRWGSNSDLLHVWKMYEDILWTTTRKQTIAKVVNLMGQIFLFGSYREIFDYNLAFSYFKVASMMNDGDAMYNMAFMIEKKLLPSHLYHIPPKNLYRVAMLNYWCSAQSHSQKAQLLLGFRYLNGIGTNKSCLDSVFFYQKLAQEVRMDARSLDKYVEVIDLADPPQTVQDLNMDEDQIRYYKQYAAMGKAWANNHLGQVYLFGLRGIAQNYQLAAQHFEAAANANDPVAANYLGRLYWNGLGLKRDLNKTRQLFTFAAQRNVSQAQNNLAFMWWKGIGSKPNMTQALKWFKRAAALDFAQAMFYLGEIYKNGDRGVEKNISQAVEYYIAATKRRHYRSMYELGVLYKDGIGVIQDCDKAVALFKYVAEYHNVKFELEHARTAYEEGRYPEAYVLYAQKAEEGYINGEINAAYLAKHGYHTFLYDVEKNPYYDSLAIKKEKNSFADDTIKVMKFNDEENNGECDNNASISHFICQEQQQHYYYRYLHKVVIPENKELAFRYYSLAAAQNHSRSLRILGDYYWYEWPPIHLFSYLSNVTFNIINDEEEENEKNKVQIDEYDQRSMSLSIAYLSTPHSILQYSNMQDIEQPQAQHKADDIVNQSIKLNKSEEEQEAIQTMNDNLYVLRHERIACYLYELASLQSLPEIDAQSLYDYAYCFEHGRGRPQNISRARHIYWNAMNSSSQAWIPVFITLMKMETIHLYKMQNVFEFNMENIVLCIAIMMLMIIFCIKAVPEEETQALDPMVTA